MSDVTKSKPRPVDMPTFRNIAVSDLARYRLPLPGIASIIHRITGIALFFGLILLLPMLQMSLKSEAGFEAFRTIVWGNPLAKLVLIGLLFAIIYHLIAGIRHVIQDSGKWLDLQVSRNTASAVFVSSVVLTALIVWRLW
ncbi:MAG: succinate dehydrogenase, cytochrome b556 subunit [Betaproteobacteria bacterium]|nr:MAG: succinate dehydrogenase, cytochrome b556 subunit [Betaproteobacteria bacterium]